MRKRTLLVIFVTIFVFFLGSLPAICDDTEKNSQLLKYYENSINDKISKCHSKAQLKKSKSTNLQNCALTGIKKANYYSANKEMLAKEMVVNNVGVKQYKVDHFLNKKFFENNEILHGKRL
jgi:hypothetical protein